MLKVADIVDADETAVIVKENGAIMRNIVVFTATRGNVS